MFDIAWSELALIGAVALIVIGPKDLPKVMRTAGQWTRKARLLAGEFQHSMDEMVRQSELEELRKQVQSVNPAAAKFGDFVQDAVKSVTDPVADLAKAPFTETPAAEAETKIAANEIKTAEAEPVAVEKPAATDSTQTPEGKGK